MINLLQIAVMEGLLHILVSLSLLAGLEQDSTVVLRYDLPIGSTYTYQVTTDQYVLPNTYIRLHSIMVIEVMGRDEDANTICRLKLQSDTSALQQQASVPTRKLDHLVFGGDRLYSDVGFLDVTINDRGELVDDRKVYEERNRPSSISTQYDRITEVSMDQQVAQQRSGPMSLQMIIPSIAGDNPLSLHRPYVDTVTTVSKSVHLPTSYGPAGVAERVILYDTLIRVTTIDSLHQVGVTVRGYVTVVGNRTTGLGTKYQSTSHLQRDMRSGLIESLSETCYRVTAKGPKIAYASRAVLMGQDSKVINTSVRR